MEQCKGTWLGSSLRILTVSVSFAGSDSTASTMQSFFYHILKDRRVYDTLVGELDRAEKLGSLSDPVRYEESIHLPYFQAALTETMRVRPAVGLNITRHVPALGIEIDGTWFQGGTAVAVNGNLRCAVVKLEFNHVD